MMIKHNSGSASCKGGRARYNGRRLLLSVAAALVAVVTVAFGSAVKPAEAYAVTYPATVTPTIENASVAYFAWHNASDTASVSLKPVTGAGTLVEDFTSDSQPGYMVFFVKPDSNYILTGLGAHGDAAGDIYSINATSYRISGYPGIANVIAEAKRLGYVGFFGYRRNASRLDAVFEVHGQQPSVSLSVSCDKSAGVKPGDLLTFTITATPQTKINDMALVTEELNLTSLTVNGTKISGVTLSNQGDGTWKGTCTYEATAQDCTDGSVSLEAAVATKYGYALGVTDSHNVTGTIKTESTIATNASITCAIADSYGVSYEFIGDVPSSVTAPTDNTRYYEGQTVTVKPVADKTVTEGNYTYNFKGWTLNGRAVNEGSTVTVNSGLHFIGNWTKVRNTGNLAISKTVTGNAANKDENFTFELSSADPDIINKTYTVTCSDGTTEKKTFTNGETTITLRHGQTKTLAGLPAGAKVKVQESDQQEFGKANTSTTVTVNDGEPNNAKETNVDITSGGTVRVAFTNQVTFAPDTGVSLNALPMVTLAGVAVLGGAVVAVTSVRKSNRERDDR